jgi:hypothetical protein
VDRYVFLVLISGICCVYFISEVVYPKFSEKQYIHRYNIPLVRTYITPSHLVNGSYIEKTE